MLYNKAIRAEWMALVAGQLLSTKLYAPQTHPKLVARTRLTERLNPDPGHKLTLISAPAGYGKTSLLSQWIAHSSGTDTHVAWLSLDEGDSDPTRFWTYFFSAIENALGGLVSNPLELVGAPGQPPIESILGSLINDLAAAPQSITLILDDYHSVNHEDIHRGLAFLLEHLPPQKHLVIATRADPPLPLSRWRARGQLIELGLADLRFTSEEAAQFLNDSMALSLSVQQVEALEGCTEGWIAGLQLAALSMLGREDSMSFIADFTGENRYVLDYLAQEVLRNQPEEVQTFLLQTSILERLSGPLCDAVTSFDTQDRSSQEGQSMLDRLEQSNLFLIPLDDKRQWYRYHHLFAEFLRKELRNPQSYSSEGPAPSQTEGYIEGTRQNVLPDLHRRASQWYEQNGFSGDAIRHALAARDFQSAARLIEENATPMLLRREITTLLGWIDPLPEELVRSRPGLSLSYAYALFENGRIEEVEPHLQAVEDGLATIPSEPANADMAPALGRVAALRSFVACYQGNVSRALELSYQALKFLPTDDLYLRSGIAANIAGNQDAAFGAEGDVAEAARVLSEATNASEQQGNTYAAIFSLCFLAELEVRRGLLHEAGSAYRRALRLARSADGAPLPVAGPAYVGMGDLLREWNDLGSAEQYLTEGINLAEQSGDLGTLTLGYVSFARVLQAYGNLGGAYDLLDKAEEATRKSWAAWAAGQIGACRALLWLAEGNLGAAVRWAQAYSLGVGKELGYRRELEYSTLARVLIAQGQHEQAIALLDRLLSVAETAQLNGIISEMLALKSLALKGMGNSEGAKNMLKQAILLAEPAEYVRLFVDKGSIMADLLRGALSRGENLKYVTSLLETFGTGDPFQPAGVQVLADPLSERELEVLRLIASGHSNRKIAEQLVIGLGTVKTHINNVYRKLDVQSRTQALARSRELDLL